MPKALFLEDISLRHDGRQYLSEVNLSVRAGEVVAICGTSGSHKDALMRLITRMYPATYSLTGQLLVDNVDTERLHENEMRYARMMNIAVLPQSDVLDGMHKTVKQYITAPFCEDLKKNAHQILLDTKRIMQLLGITDPERILSKRIKSLSKKEKRAVVYAAALSTDPAIALLSVSSMDISDLEADTLYTLLIKVCKIKNTTLIFMTSDIHFARKYAETVYIMHKDRLWPLEGASHPYLRYLEKAAKIEPLTPLMPNEKSYMTATKVIARRGMESLNFVLHSGEVRAVPAKNALSVFTGKRRPRRGSLLYEDTFLHKSRTFKKKSLLIHKDMIFPPSQTVKDVLRAFGNIKKEADMLRFLPYIGLPTDYAQMSTADLSLYETFRLGMLAAVASGVHTILLYKPELLTDTADQYDILTMLHDIVEKTGICALVLTDEPLILNAFSAPLAEADVTSAEKEALAYADAE